MYRSLSSFVPNAADFLDLAVEELAGILLLHLNSYEGVSGNTVHQHAGVRGSITAPRRAKCSSQRSCRVSKRRASWLV